MHDAELMRGLERLANARCDLQRETRAESSGRLAFPDGIPAVTGDLESGAGGKCPPPASKLSGPAWSNRPKKRDLGRSARLHHHPLFYG